MALSQASRETLVCSVISNWTGRPVFFVTIVARSRTLAPEQTSSKRSLTESHGRSLLSIAKLKSARSRHLREISSRTRIDQTCLGWSGFFCPTSNPLFQGRDRFFADKSKHDGFSAIPPGCAPWASGTRLPRQVDRIDSPRVPRSYRRSWWGACAPDPAILRWLL
jgi:hypothetical protein